MFVCNFVLTICLLLFIVVYHLWTHTYWQRKRFNQLHIKCTEHLGLYFKRLYDVIKANGWKHAGIYMKTSPVYIPADLEIIKHILTRDFPFFPHRGIYFNEENDPLSAHIFNLSGLKWKRLRLILNPIFTPVRMKQIFPILLECQKNLVNILKSSDSAVDIKKLAEEFVFDVIGCCAFGLDPTEDNSKFKEIGRRILKRSTSRRVKGLVVEHFPRLGQWLNICLIPKHVSQYLIQTVQAKLEQRQHNNIRRGDFLQVLAEKQLPTATIAAQSFIFFLAGFTTSPALISFALYELAANQDIQGQVRNEIVTVLKTYNDEMCYDAVQDLKYMNQVIDETLRKYPPAAYLTRQCVESYRIPGSGLVIDKGTIVQIPVLGIHYDETYYPEPNNFDPERFTEENRSSRDRCAFIPFGDGPRTCLGLRFGLIQSKLALASLLMHYRFSVSSRTQEPLTMKPNTLVLTAVGDIWLDIENIN